MHNLIYLTGGSFRFETFKKIVPRVEFLINQPQLKVDNIFADRDPKFSYREIFISSSLEYHVMDMGRVKDVPSIVTLGSRIYSEKDVEKLMQGD